MNPKIKSIFIFIVLTGVLFYFANLVARESGFTIEDTGHSARFLDIVAVLGDIQFDLDFINSLGDTAIKTDVYIQPLSSSDAGRDNPFKKSSPSTLFQSPGDVFPGQGQVRAIEEAPSAPPAAQLPAGGEDFVAPSEVPQDFVAPSEEEQRVSVPSEESFGEEEFVAPLEEGEDVVVPEEETGGQAGDPSNPSSATLTR